MPEVRILRLIAGRLPGIAATALLAAAAELAAVALIAVATWLLATAASQPPLTALTVAIVAVRTFAIGRGVLRYLDRLAGHNVVLGAMAGLRSRFFHALTPLAPNGSGMLRRGDLLTRLVSDVDAVQDLVLRVLTPMFTALVVAIVACGFTAFFSPAAAAVLAAGLLLAGAAVPLLSARLAVAQAKRTSRSRAALASATVDAIHGSADLMAAGATEWATRRASDHAAELGDGQRRGTAAVTATTALGTAISGLTVVGVLLTANGLGVMTAVLALTALVTFESVAGLPQAARRATEIRASAARLVELLDTAPPVTDPARPSEVDGPRPRLRLEDLRPEIPGRGACGEGVTLDLPPGRRIGLVGASGSGKSMLLAALVRFTPIASGKATLDGIELCQLRGDEVRTHIGGMMQDSHLFARSVADNLRIADPDATVEMLEDVLSRVGLPDIALDLPVGEDGERLSGGQRQRLLLARALLGRHPILLLDEPTEHLDPDTADAVLRDIVAATADRALILVTHRLTGLEQLDEVLLLDDGTVVQRGTHAQLASQSGTYRDWCQAGTFAAPGATV